MNVLSDSEKIITVHLARSLVVDVAKGVAYLHCMNILHRDLKSPNILVSEKNLGRRRGRWR
jgi:serine/threonine protein kinase